MAIKIKRIKGACAEKLNIFWESCHLLQFESESVDKDKKINDIK